MVQIDEFINNMNGSYNSNLNSVVSINLDSNEQYSSVNLINKTIKPSNLNNNIKAINDFPIANDMIRQNKELNEKITNLKLTNVPVWK
jgi:hypothetical protein